MLAAAPLWILYTGSLEGEREREDLIVSGLSLSLAKKKAEEGCAALSFSRERSQHLFTIE